VSQLVFLTLFLGLVSGKQPLALKADANVKSVRIVIDGTPMATLTEPPWRAEIDFGPALLPHEVDAVGLDAGGKEIARATQFVNVPRPQAEAEIVVDRNAEGRPARAQVVVRHLGQATTRGATMTLDDAALPLDRDFAAALPAVDMKRPHLLMAEVKFADGAVARRELVFGGEFAESAEAQLTPVAIVRTGDAEPKGDCFVAGGKPLHVRSIEAGEADVIVVRDPSNATIKSQIIKGIMPTVQRYATLDPGTSAHLLSAVAENVRDAAGKTEIFPLSASVDASHSGMLYMLTTLNLRQAGPRQWADATAVAGVRAAARGHRRAVVLVVGEAPDKSDYQPAIVRNYLAALGVPLFVWSPGGALPELAARWGAVEDMSGAGRVVSGTQRIQRELARQRIAWVEADPVTALRAEVKDGCGYARAAR
jgi:hypothetical protein